MPRSDRDHLALRLILMLLACCARPLAAQAGVKDSARMGIQIPVADSAEAKPIDAPRLAFPVPEQQKGHEAVFAAVFVIDTLGRVEMTSVTFSRAEPPLFYDAACAALGKTTYTTVRRADVATRAIVVQSFEFKLMGGALEHTRADVEGLRQVIRREGYSPLMARFAKLPHCQ